MATVMADLASIAAARDLRQKASRIEADLLAYEACGQHRIASVVDPRSML